MSDNNDLDSNRTNHLYIVKENVFVNANQLLESKWLHD